MLLPDDILWLPDNWSNGKTFVQPTDQIESLFSIVHSVFLLTDPGKLSFEKGDQLELLDGDGFQFLHRRQIEERMIDEMYCFYFRNCTTKREGYMKPSTADIAQFGLLLDNPNGNKLNLY